MAIFTRTHRRVASEIGFGALGPRTFILPMVALVLFLAGAAVVDSAFAGRAVPGLRVGGVDVGALDADGIRARLLREASGPFGAATVRATLDGRSFEITNAELGLVPDLDRSAEEALRFGRQGAPLLRLDAWLDALTGRAALTLATRAENGAAEAWLAEVAAAVDRPAVDAEIRRTAGGLEVVPGASGVAVDRERLLAAILKPATLGDREIPVPVRTLLPVVDQDASRDALALARATLGGLELTAGDRTIVEDAAALATLVWSERIPAGSLAEVPAGAVVPDQRSRWIAWVRDENVRAWAAAVAAALDRPARNATYRIGASDAYEVVPAQDGIRIDQDALVAAVVAELGRGGAGRHVIAAPMTVDLPRFTTAEAQSHLGALSTVATFRTAFPVNPARYTNIRIGASFFDGVVVAPGEELSFWSVFGDDPASKGFVPAGAIVNGISDNSVVGGGLCQVSTTLFNAVLNGGYEVVERHAHSYLIERYPIGLDAAVFFPGADMRWRNDTAYPVLIRSAVTPTSVTFSLVSVPTGRTVTFSAAAQSRWVPVTPSLRPDPGHAAGYSVAGRDISRVRTVTEGGAVIHRDVFFSRYAPVWGGPAVP